jgi:hypothetical protein
MRRPCPTRIICPENPSRENLSAEKIEDKKLGLRQKIRTCSDTSLIRSPSTDLGPNNFSNSYHKKIAFIQILLKNYPFEHGGCKFVILTSQKMALKSGFWREIQTQNQFQKSPTSNAIISTTITIQNLL